MEKSKKAEQEMDFEEIKEYLQIFCEKIKNRIRPPWGELVSKILVPLGIP